MKQLPPEELAPLPERTTEQAIKSGITKLLKEYDEYIDGVATSFYAYFFHENEIHAGIHEQFQDIMGISLEERAEGMLTTPETVNLFFVKSDHDIVYGTNPTPYSKAAPSLTAEA